MNLLVNVVGSRHVSMPEHIRGMGRFTDRWYQTITETGAMDPGEIASGERFDVAYLILSGTTTAVRVLSFCKGLQRLVFPPSSHCRRQTPHGWSHPATWRMCRV